MEFRLKESFRVFVCEISVQIFYNERIFTCFVGGFYERKNPESPSLLVSRLPRAEAQRRRAFSRLPYLRQRSGPRRTRAPRPKSGARASSVSLRSICGFEPPWGPWGAPAAATSAWPRAPQTSWAILCGG